MATDPRRIMNLTSSGIVPVERTQQTFGAGVPEAQKLAAERINSLPPPSFDVAVQHLASAAPMSAEGMQRLAVANMGTTPAPVGTAPGSIQTMANVGQRLAGPATPMDQSLVRANQLKANLPPQAQQAVQAGIDRRMANQARFQARRADNLAARQSRQQRIRDLLAARQPGGGGLLGAIRANPSLARGV